MPTRPARPHRGFSPIELLIAVSVVGLLPSIAAPSWRATMGNAYRSQARHALLVASQYLETQYAIRNAYCPAGGCSAKPLPSPLRSVPSSGERAYGIVVVNLSDNAFELRAVPASGGAMVLDACGSLSLDSVGRRGQSGSPANPAACWPR